MRTIIVIRPIDGTEIGRATLQPDGSVAISGFEDAQRRIYQQHGIIDYRGRAGTRGATISVTQGHAFLDALEDDWQREAGFAHERET